MNITRSSSQCYGARFLRIRVAIFCIAISFALLCVMVLRAFRIIDTSGSRVVRSNIVNIGNVKENDIARRLDIVDRNHALLARNILAYDFYVQPSKMFDIATDLQKIMELFPFLKKRREQLENTIYKKVNDANARVLIASSIFPIDREKILDRGIIGVHFEEKQKRIYPHNNTASHIVGFISSDGIGISGIEKYFNAELENIHNGNPIQLSIDINIQAIVRNCMMDAIKKYKAKSATGIIMNVRTGEIISAVSLPDFNPNNLRQYNNNNLFNRFSLGVYELGSVFKIFLATLAVQQNLSLTKRYDTVTPLQVGKYTVTDFITSKTRRDMNIKEIIRYSSNIGCGRVMEDVAPGSQQELFHKLGLFDKMNIELPERGRPIVPSHWYVSNMITASYGHGIAVSPLHFIAAASSIVNDGLFVNPTFVKVANNNDIKVGEHITSVENSQKLRSLLRDVVLMGGGRKVAVNRYDVGGKAGTAIQVKDGKYNHYKVIASFFAIVPTSKPEYAFYITIEEPHITKINNYQITGGGIVAPIIGNIIALTGPMLHIPIMEDIANGNDRNIHSDRKTKKPISRSSTNNTTLNNVSNETKSSSNTIEDILFNIND